MSKKLKVAVVMGGRSSGHEISIQSGYEVLKNLDKNKYIPFPIVTKKDGSMINLLESQKNIDLAFRATHGEHTVDGAIQGVFEVTGIPCTGSRLFASALTMDKIINLSLANDKNN